jgi:pimeloyl-ACP methyl ester carboxylesterase
MSTTTSVLNDLHHEVRGSGAPVLFIPGASGDAGHFARTAARLADEFTTVTFDRRGCSRSASTDGTAMSIAAQADDAAALIQELGLAPALVFGTSGGGNILLEVVARHPQVLRAAIAHEPALVAIALRTRVPDEEFERMIELAGRQPRAAMEAFVRTHTSDETFERLDPELRERVLGNGEHFFMHELAAFASYLPDTEQIRRTGVPLRLLASRSSSADDREPMGWLASELGVPIELVSGHHAPYLQAPEAFAEELRPILAELS